MERPGRAVRDEPDYRLHDAAHRRYWETGANPSLTRGQRAVLRRWSAAARSEAGPVDHGAIARAVAEFVRDAMPRGEIEGTESPKRTLGWIVDSGVGEPGDIPPPDTDGVPGAPGWVCINAAALAGALYRDLGYPVRECNVYLAQNGSLEKGYRGSVYQQAALQVWFEGAWHWVDPYLATFDPAATRDDASRYKVDLPCYWSGTSPPTEWHPALPCSGWLPFGLLEPVGSDLQRRFQPKEIDEPGARVRRPGSAVDRRGGTVTSGVWIRTRAESVVLQLVDADGRPAGQHIARGTPMPGLDPRAEDDPAAPCLRDRGACSHLETVFFGTRSLLASWEEVGRHELALLASGPRGGRIDLACETTAGDHRVTVCGLPSAVELADGSAAVRFAVVIDPVDPAFHAQFAVQVASGALSPESYWSAADELRAMRERERAAGAERERLPVPSAATT
jgi:hypothetical protein